MTESSNTPTPREPDPVGNLMKAWRDWHAHPGFEATARAKEEALAAAGLDAACAHVMIAYLIRPSFPGHPDGGVPLRSTLALLGLHGEPAEVMADFLERRRVDGGMSISDAVQTIANEQLCHVRAGLLAAARLARRGGPAAPTPPTHDDLMREAS